MPEGAEVRIRYLSPGDRALAAVRRLPSADLHPAAKWVWVNLWIELAGCRPATIVTTAAAVGALCGIDASNARKHLEALKAAGLADVTPRLKSDRSGRWTVFLLDPAEAGGDVRRFEPDPQGEFSWADDPPAVAGPKAETRADPRAEALAPLSSIEGLVSKPPSSIPLSRPEPTSAHHPDRARTKIERGGSALASAAELFQPRGLASDDGSGRERQAERIAAKIFACVADPKLYRCVARRVAWAIVDGLGEPQLSELDAERILDGLAQLRASGELRSASALFVVQAKRLFRQRGIEWK